VQSFERNTAWLRSGAAAQGAVREGGTLKCLVSLGENFENVGFGEFSKMLTIFFGRRLAVCGDRPNFLQATADAGCGCFDGFHRTEDDGR
jgi:hypothetical protein